MRYAQPNKQGCYQIRLPFARSNHGAYKNSAWLRMSTPYAAGAQLDGMEQDKKPAGMHFPLSEGTEVLIAFLNGDPDLPVTVGSLPNAEANRAVGQGKNKKPGKTTHDRKRERN